MAPTRQQTVVVAVCAVLPALVGLGLLLDLSQLPTIWPQKPACPPSHASSPPGTHPPDLASVEPLGAALRDDSCWSLPTLNDPTNFTVSICAPSRPSTGSPAYLVLQRTSAFTDSGDPPESEYPLLHDYATAHGPDSHYVWWQHARRVGAVAEEAKYVAPGVWEYDLKGAGDGHEVVRSGQLALKIVWSYTDFSYAWPSTTALHTARPNVLLFPSLPGADRQPWQVQPATLPPAGSLVPVAPRPPRGLRPCSRVEPISGNYVAADDPSLEAASDRELMYTFVPDGCQMGAAIPRVDRKGSAGASAETWTSAKRNLLFLGESHDRQLGRTFISMFGNAEHLKSLGSFQNVPPPMAVGNVDLTVIFDPWLQATAPCNRFLEFDTIIITSGHHWLNRDPAVDVVDHHYGHLWEAAESASFIANRVEFIRTCFVSADKQPPTFVVLTAPAHDPIRLNPTRHDARSNIRLAMFRDALLARLAHTRGVRLIDQYELSKPWIHEFADHSHLNGIPLRAVMTELLWKLDLTPDPVAPADLSSDGSSDPAP